MTTDRGPCGHFGHPSGCTRTKRRVAEFAPNCPNPTRQMLYEGCSYSRTCPCESCTERRQDHAAIAVESIRNREPDEIVVERLVMGSPVHSTRVERLLAYEILRRKRPDLSGAKLAERLGVSTRTIERYRSLEQHA